MGHVALLRGVNIGGVKVLMADLRRIAEGLGWGNPQTFIASGNLLFSAPEGDLGPALEAALKAEYGRDLPVIVLQAPAFRAAVATCPWKPEAGRHVHGFLLLGAPGFDTGLYDRLRRPGEEVALSPGIAWLHAPQGVGRSDLALKIEKVLGTTATGRNLNSLRSLCEMLDARAAG